MRKVLDFLLKIKIYNNLHKFLGSKIFKFYKIFFVETNLKNLPASNHPLDIYYEEELRKFKLIKNSNIKPFVSYSHILDLLKICEKFKKGNIKFLDFGAGNLELFAYLSKNLKKLKYFYYDQDEYISIIEKITKKNNLKNFEIIKNLNAKSQNFDFVHFGGSLQYINDYKGSLKKIFKKTNYIIISQTPFYFNKHNQVDIILKQLNLSYTLNYLYLINYFKFIKFLKDNKFTLISLTSNRVIKFINFKNLKNKYKKIDMYDLIFEKK